MLLPRVLHPLELPPAINWPEEEDMLVWIYGLSDPRDGRVAAISRSMRPCGTGHFAPFERDGLRQDPSPREQWLMDLARSYRFPVTHLLAVAPSDWAEEYKRIYVGVAQVMEPGLTTPAAAWRWKIPHDIGKRVEREAQWVLAQSYPSLPGAGPCPDPVEPCYDERTQARLMRPPLTPSDWVGLQRTLRHRGGRCTECGQPVLPTWTVEEVAHMARSHPQGFPVCKGCYDAASGLA